MYLIFAQVWRVYVNTDTYTSEILLIQLLKGRLNPYLQGTGFTELFLEETRSPIPFKYLKTHKRLELLEADYNPSSHSSPWLGNQY